MHLKIILLVPSIWIALEEKKRYLWSKTLSSRGPLSKSEDVYKNIITRPLRIFSSANEQRLSQVILNLQRKWSYWIRPPKITLPIYCVANRLEAHTVWFFFCFRNNTPDQNSFINYTAACICHVFSHRQRKMKKWQTYWIQAGSI